MKPIDKRNIIAGVVGLVATGVGFIAKGFYREYTIVHNIYDFGLADSLPSLLYVIGFSQLLLIKPTKYWHLKIIVVTAGSVIYEIWQYNSMGILDSGDVYASIAGGLISFVLFKTIMGSREN